MNNLKRTYDFLGGEILLFDKDLNWTSFDLVQRVRNSLCRKMGIKKMKVGHAGTLDPLATGLMILCTGKATKKIEELQLGKKEYFATFKIGATTPSFDMETEEDKTFDYSHVNEKLIFEVLKKFEGETEQVPPVFSAVKVKGKRAFEYARNGEELKLQAKKIVIERIDIESVELPFIKIKVVCSKGTYIRALARDVGEELNCGAYLTNLRRTKIGNYRIEDAVKVDFFMENLHLFVTN
ncbi:tRNA pseudouridine(55) synthase TruB [Maribellus comscasis]|uniref:tRNA pseudouridine synthase B n=1 Tax=Maribellus comscasis TaxID=2681766 RepID=A0A6I6JL16_9BACT|nr:tRNA pseudouridine(55) synthase TruB [Maribellus comscasis]QGY43545.1 tRNA pseudouridine(55) synthase TruB [Maribellus comscasis]